MTLPSPPILNVMVRGTTTMSLNERFTALRQIAAARSPQKAGIKSTQPLYSPRPLLFHQQHRPHHHHQQQQQQHQAGVLRRSAAMEAALKIKKKSLKQRLGRADINHLSNNRASRGSRRRLHLRPYKRQFSLWTNTSLKRNIGPNFRGSYRGRGRHRGFPSSHRRPFRKPIRRSGPPPTKAELDAQLDSYMSSTKSLLDDTPME